MGSRKKHEGADKVYEAAQKWVDCALRADGSLFTPDEAIWTSQGLGDLRKRFLDQPDVGEGSFYDKLKAQLENSPPEVYQLMGEVLYAHFLMVWRTTMGGDAKGAQINQVLEWSDQNTKIPSSLVDSLTPGIASSTAFNTYRQYHVGFLIEFVEQWKKQEPSEHQRLLNEPWAFKDFVTGLRFRSKLLGFHSNAHAVQREALYHLVFPDTFESIAVVGRKEHVAARFANLVTEPTNDVDRKLAQIRRRLEARYGSHVSLDDPDIPVPSDPWDGTTRPPEPPVRPVSRSRYSDLQTLAAQLHLPADFLREIETLLKDKRQIIFQGPPGTGKTYVAQKLAKHFAGPKGRVTLVQLHPSYAYEDFVQGFRPALVGNGQPGFALRDGPLLRAANRAKEEPDEDHFLVIDEINRGNLAKVLGELYFLLEYRDEKIRLQYQGDHEEDFSLPSNLYIIGTMNTADRSIALVDLALRRRFYFVEFHPDEEPVKGVLRRWLEANAPGEMEWVAGVVDRANEKLRDDRHAAIGPSYFMKDGLDDDAVRRIWKHSVLPYVEERLFGEGDRLGEFALDKLLGSDGPGSAGDGDGQRDGDEAPVEAGAESDADGVSDA